MEFIADFHVHSRFSRATAKNLDLENLYIAAQLKGITVVGTGDFTHPGWFAEIKQKLVPAEPGLYKLRKEISKICDQQVPRTCGNKVRFILVSEISNIYKKKKKTRKNHNLVFIADMDAVEKFNSRLDKIGNINSDGRPILGLDARNLLEIVLDISESSFLVPAHIWTPWFSLFGSKSGFDSMAECFEDLTSHIFAVETGLSSDPAMNWRISELDKMTFISNSDAHSPLKMGREANLFNTSLSFSAIRKALQFGDPKEFLGTIEFYPEEGKYHLDGHRKCNVRMWPKHTKKAKGICPVCQKPLTLGVMYRIEELADRPKGVIPEKTHPFYNLIPLVEILAEVLKVGPGSKKVNNKYMSLLEKLGPELAILKSIATETIEKVDIPLLAEAIKRMRQNQIKLLPGYDGEFGKISIFDPQERDVLLGQQSLFLMSAPTSPIKKAKKAKQKRVKTSKRDVSVDGPYKQTQQKNHIMKGVIKLNQQQKQAVEHSGGPLIITAGPGTGKTRTLTQRIAYLVKKQAVSTETVLAITFTNKAADEMRERLEYLLDESNPLPFVGTFHRFCFEMLKEYKEKSPTILDEHDRYALILDAIRQVEKNGEEIDETPQTILDWIIFAKQNSIGPTDDCNHIPDSKKALFFSVYKTYQNLLYISELYDFEDLIFETVRLFETDNTFVRTIRNRFQFIFVDEFQDLNHGQYRMITSLVPPDNSGGDICVIGDPDQAIYGFRGSDSKYFNCFIKDYQDVTTINLVRNYRSTQTILEASQQVIKQQNKDSTRLFSRISGIKTISVLETSSAKAEAVAVGKVIEDLIGGVGFHSIDFDKVDDTKNHIHRSFSDIAVLFRTSDQIRIFTKIFDSAGIPYQVVSRKRIFDAKNIKSLVSFLKIIEGFGCCIDFERIMKWQGTGFNKREIASFKGWCYQNNLSFSSAMAYVKRFPVKEMTQHTQRKLAAFTDTISTLKEKIQGLTIEKKLAYIRENTTFLKTENNDENINDALDHLFNIAKTTNTDLHGFLSQISLKVDTDTHIPHAERVTLMTIHAAKGLEFPVVFIAGCEDGYLPYRRFANDNTDINEERRLFYVGVTRAQEMVYLTYTKKRNIYGQTRMRKISPFVENIDDGLKLFNKRVYEKRKKKGSEQLKLF